MMSDVAREVLKAMIEKERKGKKTGTKNGTNYGARKSIQL